MESTMNLPPYDRFTIKTYLSPEAARAKLERNIEPHKLIRLLGSHDKPYQGAIEGYRFQVTRIIHYRNSFLPVISGEIQPDYGGALVTITMRPHGFVLFFMIIWLGMVGMGLLTFLAAFMNNVLAGFPITSSDTTGVVMAGLMFVLGAGTSVGGYKFEAVKSRRFFEELFEAQSGLL
jgi:hypothetical protein